MILCLAVLGVGNVPAAPVTVFAASSLAVALGEIGSAYERTTKEQVRFNFAGSNTLARQIKEGAPADVFVSADEAKMDDVEKAGRIVTSTRRDRLANTLVVVVPVESTLKISQIADLAAPEVKRVATGDPQAVPVGIYAREYLSKRGLWSLLAPRVVPVVDVRAALAAVAAGNAEAAIVYKTDASVSPKVRIALEIVGDDAPQIRYPVAILKEAPESFVDYLFSTEAGAIFTQHGFPVLEPSHTK